LFADCEVFAMIEDTTLDRRAILAEIDRVINDMVKLRARVASAESMTPVMSSKSWEIFDMWADRAALVSFNLLPPFRSRLMTNTVWIRLESSL
jgi:hypothetical protein